VKENQIKISVDFKFKKIFISKNISRRDKFLKDEENYFLPI
jgi:hypothetical protein